jgi:DNA-binding MarR family transcriptional regulator
MGTLGFRTQCGLKGPVESGTILFARMVLLHNNHQEKRMARSASVSSRSPDPSSWPTFLLSQVGAHAAARFADKLAPLGLKPPHAGVLRALDRADGLSQQALGDALGTFPSRLVVLLDELEERKLVERRDRPGDRRSYALHLTDAGREALKQIARVARQHQDDLCAALDESEREQLAKYLRRIAEQQGLAPGIHPGWKPLSEGRTGRA